MTPHLRWSTGVALSTLLLIASLPAIANAQPQPVATEVYRVDFESGLDRIVVITPGASLTVDPAEVLEGTRAVKLSGIGATIALHPDLIRLEPAKLYVVEYRYRALTTESPLALGVGFSLSGDNGTRQYLPLRGPVITATGPGSDARSARATSVNDTFLFHAWGANPVIVDDIRLLRLDVPAGPPVPAVTALGFPRLANYQLLAPDTIALINGVSQEQSESILPRYDFVMGTAIDHTIGAAAWARRLRAANPKLGLLPYKQAFMAQFDGGIESSGLLAEFNGGLQPSWFMRTPSGELLSEPAFPQNVQLNHTPIPAGAGTEVNNYTADFLATRVLSSDLWAGIHFDQPEWYINPLLGASPQIDLDGDGAADPPSTVHPAWALGFFDYFATMSRRLGPSTLLFGNAGHIPGNPTVLPMLNGWQGEVISPYRMRSDGDWITEEPSRWYRLLHNYRLATTLSRAPQIVSLQFTGSGLGQATGGFTPNGYPQRLPVLEWRDYRRMRLGLTTALLGDGFYEYDLVDNTTPPQWFDEYAVNGNGVATTAMSGKGYLGQPLGPAGELAYSQGVMFELDFEQAGAPGNVFIGPGTLSTDPAEVIAGARSLVVSQSDITEGKWFFVGQVPLVPGRTYQLFADYRILDYQPTTFLGLFGIGFRDAQGGLPPERSASLFLPDTDGPGQHGTLRAVIKASRPDIEVVGGLIDTGAVAIDNVRLIEGTGGVWRRDFENGVVLANPTPEPLYVSQAELAGPRGRTGIRRISGTQDPVWNDGSPVTAGIWIGPGDGIVLLAARHAAAPPAMPGSVMILPQTESATLAWDPAPSHAGYIVRYGESLADLTSAATAGPSAMIQLTNLVPGTSYVARITAIDYLGNEGPARDVSLHTSGAAPVRPIFTLSAATPAIAPGSYVQLEGSGLADAEEAANGPALPLTIGTTTVRVNGAAAALMSVAPGQIAFLAPWEVTGDRAVITVTRGGVTSAERSAPIVAARPWLFVWPGTDIAIATHGNGTVVTGDASAAPGELIDLLTVGLGAIHPFPTTGSVLSSAEGAHVAAPVDVRIGGVAAEVQGAWPLPGSSAAYGVRVRVPASVPAGLAEVEITVGGAPGNTARIPIQLP